MVVEVLLLTRKAVRQKLTQTAALDKIEREGLRIDTPEILDGLLATKQKVRGAAMAERVARWEWILISGDLDSVRRIVRGDDEDSQEMRNLSPLAVLLTEDERLAVLRALRGHFAG